ncbi:putative cytochrome p450 monooxygenase protein [Botrytis fragariae]|uniref:Putative cytochrome p450 monooxygenase protein n=1 Tax=Botrytis fragariae TaxID=1964551 RepID=A0A8H6B4L6_9HELO|nr:putative cytochrome p450 monooxygenase protein [Botrytis fragariae]KAF5878907.1 putative cytochrome p450 monooxygenase protein [Botrytis fragariae]
MGTFLAGLISPELTFKEWSFAVLVICIFYIISHTLATIYLHPLSSFPGPTPWISTRIPYITSLWRGHLAQDVYALHHKYGNIVRIAPDELSIANPRATLWHGAKSGKPVSVLNALEPATHRRFRRAMERAFTERAVGSQERLIRTCVDFLITRLQDLVEENADTAERVVVDIVRWYGFFTFDLIGDLGFGESFECLESEEYHPWVSMIFNSLRAATYRASLGYYPGLSWMLAYFVPRCVVRKQMEHWHLAVEKINRRLERKTPRPDIISLIKRDEEGKEGLSIQELQATASVIIVAGSETTVSVLSVITNYLVNNPLELAFLTSEIREKFEKEEEISIATLKETSYLNAVIQESFRLCNPTPVGLPRVVPPGGARVCGYDLPENIFVNVHPLSISLSSEYFHKPSEFHPERWLAANDSSSPFYNDNRNAVQVFGVGPRSCIGRPLAMAELQLVLARMVWRFELEKADSEAGNLKWEEQRVFTVVERKPFEVRLRTRSALP